MAMPKKKTLMGRPTLYDPAINTKIEDWMAQGYCRSSGIDRGPSSYVPRRMLPNVVGQWRES